MKKLALLTLAIFFSIVLSAQIQNVKSYSIANSNTQIGAILPAGTTIFNVEDSVNYRLLIPSVANYTLNTVGFVERIDNYAIELTEKNADSLAVHLDSLQAHTVFLGNTVLKTDVDQTILGTKTFTGDVIIDNPLTLNDSLKFVATDGDNGSLSINTDDFLDFNDFRAVRINNIDARPIQTTIKSADLEGGIKVGYLSEEGDGIFIGDWEEIFNGTSIILSDYDQKITLTAPTTAVTGDLDLTGTNPNIVSASYLSIGDLNEENNSTALTISSVNDEIHYGSNNTEATTHKFYGPIVLENLYSKITNIRSTTIGDTESESNGTKLEIDAYNDTITLTAGTTNIDGDLTVESTANDGTIIFEEVDGSTNITLNTGYNDDFGSRGYLYLSPEEGTHLKGSYLFLQGENQTLLGDYDNVNNGTKIEVDASGDEINLTAGQTTVEGNFEARNNSASLSFTQNSIVAGEDGAWGLFGSPVDINISSEENVTLGDIQGAMNGTKINIDADNDVITLTGGTTRVDGTNNIYLGGTQYESASLEIDISNDEMYYGNALTEATIHAIYGNRIDLNGVSVNHTYPLTIGDLLGDASGTKLKIDPADDEITLTAGVFKMYANGGDALTITPDASNKLNFDLYSANFNRAGSEFLKLNEDYFVFELGDITGSEWGTKLKIDAENNEITITGGTLTASNSGGDKGLLIDNSNLLYQMGDIDGAASGSHIEVDAGSGDITLLGQNAYITTNFTKANGGLAMANFNETASSTYAGTLRYRADSNNSYLEMCMQTGASTYAWVVIKTNSW